MAVVKEAFGATRDGQAVDKYILRCGCLEAEIITYGAVLRALRVPDRNREQVDVVLGYDSVAGYEEGPGYVGAVVGPNSSTAGPGALTAASSRPGRTAKTPSPSPTPLRTARAAFPAA